MCSFCSVFLSGLSCSAGEDGGLSKLLIPPSSPAEQDKPERNTEQKEHICLIQDAIERLHQSQGFIKWTGGVRSDRIIVACQRGWKQGKGFDEKLHRMVQDDGARHSTGRQGIILCERWYIG